MSAFKNVAAAGAVVLAVSWLVGCGQKSEPAAGGPAGGPPPAEVGVITVAPKAVGLATELPGRLEASRVAQVRARAAWGRQLTAVDLSVWGLRKHVQKNER